MLSLTIAFDVALSPMQPGAKVDELVKRLHLETSLYWIVIFSALRT